MDLMGIERTLAEKFGYKESMDTIVNIKQTFGNAIVGKPSGGTIVGGFYVSGAGDMFGRYRSPQATFPHYTCVACFKKREDADKWAGGIDRLNSNLIKASCSVTTDYEGGSDVFYATAKISVDAMMTGDKDSQGSPVVNNSGLGKLVLHETRSKDGITVELINWKGVGVRER